MTEERTRNPYEVLGIEFGASMEEVTVAYRLMAKKYHPDKMAHLAPEFRDLAERRMKEINAVYADLRAVE